MTRGRQDWIVAGGRVLLPGGLEQADVSCREGWIDTAPAPGARVFDAQGCLVLPGIVDVHGDAFERVLRPRPKVSFPPALALHEVDRQLIGNGITTAFHGLSASWEPGLRSFGAARDFLEALAGEAGDLCCDMHVNLRWEVFALENLAELEAWLEEMPSILLSLNDHLTAYRGLGGEHSKITRMAERSGLSPQEAVALIERLSERAGEVPEAIRRVSATAARLKRVVFAHDEITPEERTRNRALGVGASEFPMSIPTAEAAIGAGEHVILGAPNILRGGSQNNAVDAEPAVADGLCTVLASDYYYPAPLAAALKLVARGVVELPAAWQLVSAGPACAAGLTDRGEIAAGKRADLLLLDAQTHRVRAVFVAGRKVFDRD